MFIHFRQKFSALCAVMLMSLACLPARAEDFSEHLGLFANAKEVFRPLLADPREVQLALRLTVPVGHKNLGDIDVGDYFGLYRWALPWKDSYVQWSVAGGVFARFDLVYPEKDNQVIDYFASMPFDVRFGQWTTRLLPYHISSHLGDDFIKRTGITPMKYTFDSFKVLEAYEPWTCLRLYGGFNYIMRNEETVLGRYALQTGAEWRSSWWARGHAQLFLATDFQSWERVGWNPQTNTQLGVRIAHHPDDQQALSLFTEYGAGHQVYGQFFQRTESHWVMGLRMEVP